MRARALVATGVVALLGIAGPVLAHDRTGGYEEDTKTVACPAPGQQAPPNQTAPGPNDCKNGATTYQATVWDNDVTCETTDSNAQSTPVGHLSLDGDPSPTGWGQAGLCADGDEQVPVTQGRVYANLDPSGLSVTADGDKDNSQSAAKGWATATVNFAPAPPTIRCGDDGGRLDSSHAEDKDDQAKCG